MQRSETRILTTHTGSLPRPEALVRLYVAKAHGEAVDAQLATAGRAALEDAVSGSATPASTLVTTVSSSVKRSSSTCAAG